MSKAVFVIDMPENCYTCPMFNGADECTLDECALQDDDANFAADTLEKLREGCPLQELPEEMPYSGLDAITAETAEKRTSQAMEEAVARGYNLCLRRITGGCKDGN